MIQALAWFCLRNEQVHTLADFYIRRLGYLHFYPDRIKSTMNLVSSVFASYLGWDESRIQQELSDMKDHLKSITEFESDDGEA